MKLFILAIALIALAVPLTLLISSPSGALTVDRGAAATPKAYAAR